MDKVYLDSNIIILGARKNEHEALKKLSEDGKIILYISDHVNIELHGRVLSRLKEKDAALRIYDMLLPTGNFKIDQIVMDFVNKKRDAYEASRKDEENDRFFWEGTTLMPVKSMFAALWAVGAFDSSLNSFIDSDLIKVEALMNNGIKGKDALHITQAHCSNMDYFLTWDKGIIKKAPKISWLKNLKVMTPEDFIKIN